MSQAEIWTTRRLLEWTTQFFKDKGFESPRLEAEILLASAMKVSRVDLYVKFDDAANDEIRTNFRNLVKRRGLGEPVAYLVGRKEFYSLPFVVDANVLIPRPETEQLVLETIERVKKSDKAAREAGDEPKNWEICDVGTGSGCVAIALAKNLPKIRATALEISRGALNVARQNAEKNGVADRIEFVESDLFAALPTGRKFDIIVSNPPYVSASEYAELEPTVRRFEPRGALLGGETGTEIVARLVADAPNYLRSGGEIFVETSPTTARASAELFERDGRWTNVRVVPDFSKLERFVFAELKK